jgi:sugar O-acyltransferase (sialic acid O-acetyltransferase NeuD family)
VSMQKIIVYGAGGHGKVVGDILLARKNPNFAGFVDDRAELQGSMVLGVPVLGDGHWLQQEARKMNVAVALGIGDNFARQQLAEKCSAWGTELVTLVHPSASVSESARLGPGTVVMAQAAINPDARIGSAVIVNTGAVVEHDVVIGNYAHIAPNAAMGGASGLGDFSFLGLNAAVRQGVTIGSQSIIGAGAVVVYNIPDNVMAFGVPALIRRRIEKQEIRRQSICLR